ncbi:MAG: 5'/3'-nucleotidase SurE, partial [Fibrobacterota bacterium]
MKILLTNDDSITAEGIGILARHLAKNHKVTIVAPKHEMSGISHSFTLFSPLFVDEVRLQGGLNGFMVSGTPSDCVKLGVRKILTETPDLVISGFNPGENAGISSF